MSIKGAAQILNYWERSGVAWCKSLRAFAVIAGQGKNFLASNLPTAFQGPRLGSDTEIPEEIENVIGLHGGVQTFEDRLIHLLDTSKRAIAVANYVAMPEIT